MAVSFHFQFKFLPFQCLLSVLFLADCQLPFVSSSSLFMFTVLSIATEGPNSKGGPEQRCGEGQKGSHGALHIAEPDTIETILQSSWWRIRFSNPFAFSASSVLYFVSLSWSIKCNCTIFQCKLLGASEVWRLSVLLGVQFAFYVVFIPALVAVWVFNENP